MSDNGTPVNLSELFATVTVDVRVTTPYGRELVIPVHTLSFKLWNEIGRRVIEPPVPHTTLDDKTGKMLPNPGDKKYQDDLRRAEEKRSVLRAITALELAGHIVNGNSDDEKIAEVETWDRSMLIGIVNGLQEIALGKRAVFENAARSFRGESLSTVGTESGAGVE